MWLLAGPRKCNWPSVTFRSHLSAMIQKYDITKSLAMETLLVTEDVSGCLCMIYKCDDVVDHSGIHKGVTYFEMMTFSNRAVHIAAHQDGRKLTKC